MIYYIVKRQIFTIFLSMSHLSSVSFPERIGDYIGGQKGDFQVYELNKGKNLVFEPKKKNFKRSFIVFLKSSSYHFDLVYNEMYTNKDIEIKRGKECSSFVLLKETKKFQLFECPQSLFFVNKAGHPVKVNGLIIKDTSYLSKGPPLFINNKMVYYRGRFL